MIQSLKSCHFSRSDSAVWLVDNGSLRAQSVLALREQASRLSIAAGVAVEAVSVLHSNKVPADALGGQAATIFTPHLRICASSGLRRLLVVPYFFGSSAALTDYLPQQVARVQQEFPELQVRIAPPLVDLQDAEDDAPAQIAALLATLVMETAGELVAASAAGKEPLPAVVLVDHGSPQPAVSAVRTQVAGALEALLGVRVGGFAACSMEAREGEAYAHTLPLLETILGQEPFCSGTVIVAPLFLGPGRHAGQGGDLWQIAEGVRERNPALRVVFCPLPGGSPVVTDILLRRLLAGADGFC